MIDLSPNHRLYRLIYVNLQIGMQIEFQYNEHGPLGSLPPSALPCLPPWYPPLIRGKSYHPKWGTDPF